MAFNLTLANIPIGLEPSGCNDTKLLIDHYVKAEESRARWSNYTATGDPCPYRPLTTTTEPKEVKREQASATSSQGFSNLKAFANWNDKALVKSNRVKAAVSKPMPFPGIQGYRRSA
mmetsp:Transcript_67746/g.119634  ORF Transcript_67746/g.119634 Transcript_67746/m.119634 type:complete len:117 (-) Transcript_67746:102-452(-)